METKTFQTGDILFREGDDSQEAYRIVSGEVEISVRTPYGPKPVARLQEGEIFGEMGLIDDKPRSATAKALAATEVEVINEENFESGVLGDPKMLHGYLANLFERMRTTDLMLELVIRRRPESMEAVTPSLETALQETLEEGESESGAETPEAPQSVVMKSHYEDTGYSAEPILVTIEKFPFRIGRFAGDRGVGPFVSNDLMIPDGMPFQLSRNHCAIEQYGGQLVVRDRGSTVGTIVNGHHLGVKSGEIMAKLKPGENKVILGSDLSPHHFTLTVG